MKKRTDTTSASRKTTEETRYLLTAANGQDVWVPESQLKTWLEAQEKQRLAQKA